MRERLRFLHLQEINSTTLGNLFHSFRKIILLILTGEKKIETKGPEINFQEMNLLQLGIFEKSHFQNVLFWTNHEKN